LSFLNSWSFLNIFSKFFAILCYILRNQSFEFYLANLPKFYRHEPLLVLNTYWIHPLNTCTEYFLGSNISILNTFRLLQSLQYLIKYSEYLIKYSVTTLILNYKVYLNLVLQRKYLRTKTHYQTRVVKFKNFRVLCIVVYWNL
jgi:hypothetical protein